jgi:hypothetical protein
MTDVLVAVFVACVLLATGLWGRRNVEGLVPSSLSTYGQIKRARELRRGATTLIVVSTLLLLGAIARVIFVLGR